MLRIIILSLLLLATVYGACQKSHVTICDTLDDFLKHASKIKSREVIIGSNVANMSAVNMNDILQFKRQVGITILRRISQLKHKRYVTCRSRDSPLRYLSLYGNDIKTIESGDFPKLPLKVLSLVNNGIESIKKYSLYLDTIEELDVSENLLEWIEKDCLPMTNTMRILSLSRNKITQIEPGSFSTSLVYLNLDNNNLRFVQREVFMGLDNLKKLNLNSNKFKTITHLGHLKQLVVLDLSHNSISAIEEGTFKNSTELQLLDLSNNNIARSEDVRPIFGPDTHESLTVSLALNHLQDLNLTGVLLKKQSLVLYGNPFNCGQWNKVQQQLVGHGSKCDSLLLSSGSTPYCVGFEQSDFLYSSQGAQDIAKLHAAIRSAALPYECDLENKVDELLGDHQSISFECVA